MIELRGIVTSYSGSTKKVRLVVRSERGDDYKTLEYPSSKKLTRGAIISFLSAQTGENKKDIRIAPHVKIPEVITSPIKRKARW